MSRWGKEILFLALSTLEWNDNVLQWRGRLVEKLMIDIFIPHHITPFAASPFLSGLLV